MPGLIRTFPVRGCEFCCVSLILVMDVSVPVGDSSWSGQGLPIQIGKRMGRPECFMDIGISQRLHKDGRGGMVITPE